MPKIEELTNKRAAIQKKMEGVASAAESEERSLTDEELASIDDLAKEAEGVDRQIDALAKVRNVSGKGSEGTGRLTKPGEPGSNDAPSEAKDEDWGFADLGDFAHAVANDKMGRRDERIDAIKSGSPIGAAADSPRMSSRSGDDLGIEAPPVLSSRLLELVFAEGSLLGAVDRIPTSRGSLKAMADESTPWGDSGVLTAWLDSGEEFPKKKVSARDTRDLRLKKLGVLMLVEEEDLEDLPYIRERINTKVARAINWRISDSIMHGTGVGQPLGFLKGPGLVTVAQEGGQAADSINSVNLMNMYSRLIPQSISRAFWMVNPDCLPAIMQLSLNGRSAWTPPNEGIVNAPGGFLFGRPIQFSEHSETIGTLGDITLIDPRGGYLMLTRTGGMIRGATSMHLLFDQEIMAFRWSVRVDGMPWLSAPYTPARSDKTKGHFVALESRTGA